jgi:hypothetical protein
MTQNRRTRRVRTLTALVGAALVSACSMPPAGAAVPSVPTGLSVALTSTAPRVAVLTWTDTSTDETGFVVERCFDATCTSVGRVGSVGAGVTTFSDPAAPQSSTYRVRAVNGSGSSAPSNTASYGAGFSLSGVTARIVPAATTGTAPASITFDGSSSTTLNGSIIAYDWTFGDGTTATGPLVTKSFSTAGAYAVSLRVTATGPFGGGTAAAATSVLVTIAAPPVAPTPPRSLSATTPARGQVRLRWSNPATTTTNGMWVQRCTGARCTNFSSVASIILGSNSFVDAGLANATTYRYRVLVTNGSATATSNIVTVTTRR